MNKNKLREFIDVTMNNFPNKYAAGFTNDEIKELVTIIENAGITIHQDKLDDAMMGNTCSMIDNQIINYDIDVYRALVAAAENRGLTAFEWD